MTLKRKMKPSHPGGTIKDWILPEGMTITKAAKLLKVSRQSLDALVNERRSVTPEMALKLQTVFGGTAELLLTLQTRYDLYHAKSRSEEITGDLLPYKKHPSRGNNKAA